MKRLLAIPLLAAALTVAGCSHPTYFRQPLTPPGEAIHDERLIGHWIAHDKDEVMQLLIESPETNSPESLLTISATIMVANPDGEHGTATGWFSRVAHPSNIGGEIYYNIRSTEPGSAFVIQDKSGPRTPEPDETDWFNTPGHAAREYWIAKAEISDDGLLRLRFIMVNGWGEAENAGDALERHLTTHGQGESFWIESCGEYCKYARADISPSSLAEIIRTFPQDAVFNLRAGPFARLDAAVPEFEVMAN